MRDVERDGEHMWLRQSVTVSVDGQSRTLEIGIPLRAGATPDEIEALLAEADAGMERIGRHLEARIAHLGATDAPPAPAAAAASAPVAEHPTSAPAAEAAPAIVRTVTPPAAPSDATAATSSSAAVPTSARTTGVSTIAERPTPAASPAPVPAKPAAPERAPASPPAAARVPTTPPASAGTPMTIPDFIAAVQAEQGLNPKQAMEKLGVKSLAGLNLREALEMLRRQALRDGAGPVAADVPPLATASSPAPVTPSPSHAATPPRYFDEEDDAADIIFTEEDDELDAEAAGYGAAPLGADDDEELDEVPDFGSPSAEPPAVERAAPSSGQASAAIGASAAPAPEGSRAARILTHMRGMRGGGVVGAHQRSAFKNIVVAELGEPKVKALIAAIWRITPEKLGPEQLDALNNWGKRETFAEDTELVLAAVNAERERERAGAEPAGESGGASSVPPERSAPTRAAPRRASRATPTGGA